MKIIKTFFFTVGIIIVSLSANSLNAALKYWDINGATAGAGSATPSGNISGATYWSTSSAGTSGTAVWSGTTDTAVFSAGTNATGSFTVTLNSGITAAAVIVEEGTVNLATPSAITVGAGTVTINAGAGLSLDSNARISGATGGSFMLNGQSSMLRNTTTSLPSAGASFVSSVMTIALNGGGTLSESVSGSQSIVQTAVAITGTGPLVKEGAGSVAIASTCTYSGSTIINNGILRMRTTANRLPTGTDVTINSPGVFDPVTGQTIKAVNGNGAVTFSGAGTLTVNGNLDTGSSLNSYSCLSGVISGTGSLTKSGTHAMALRGANVNTGALTLSGGTLSVGAAPDRLPIGTVLSVPNGATFQLDANNQTVASVTGTGNINVGGGVLTVNQAGTGSFGGIIQDSSVPGSPTAVGHGLRGYYYDNQDFTAPKAVRDDATVNFTDLTSASQLPAAVYPNTNQFSVRWLGQVLSTAAGTYSFTVTSDDGARLWVNGTLVVNNWATQTATAKSGTVALAADTRYDIVLEYFNQTGPASAKLSWTPPGDLGASVIPTEYLFLPGPGGLTKDAAGTLTLTGTNTSSGAMIVKAGTLEVQKDGGLGLGTVSILDGATLLLDGGATNGYISSSADLLMGAVNPSLNLNFAGTNTIHSLSFDGGVTYQPIGTYGANGTTITGTGFLQVTAVGSTVTLTSSAGSSVYGSAVTFTSTVAGSGVTPTGTVTLYDAGRVIGSSTLNGSGIATLTVTGLQVINSPHSITAVYGGDLTYDKSTSAALSQTLTPLSVSPGSLTMSNKVYDATLSASIATQPIVGLYGSDSNYVHLTGGTALFTDKNVGTGKLVNITGLTLAGSLAGNYTLATNNAIGTGTITPRPLTVTGVTAVDKVYDGTTNVVIDASGAVASGVLGSDDATLDFSGATGGFTNVTVGDAKTVVIYGMFFTGVDGADYSAVGTATASIIIADSSLALASSLNPSTAGASVTFTAKVTAVSPAAGTPASNVVFSVDGTPFSTNALSGGVASASSTNLLEGFHTITAEYLGSVNFNGSANNLLQEVDAAPIIPGPITIISDGGTNVIVTWPGTAILQEATNVPMSWLDVPAATSPYTTPATGLQHYFQLRN